MTFLRISSARASIGFSCTLPPLALFNSECQYTGAPELCQPRAWPGLPVPASRAAAPPPGARNTSARRRGECRLTPRGRPAAAQEIGLDEGVDVAVQDILDITSLEARSVVLHQGVRLQDVRADLAAEVDILLGPLFHCTLLVTLSPLEIVQAGPEGFHGHVAVAVLRALVLAGGHDARRKVSDAHRRVRDVHVLAARAARAVGVRAQVLLLDGDLDPVVQVRVGVHGGERGVPPPGGIEGRDAHQPVYAALGAQEAVSVPAPDHECGALDPGLVPLLVVRSEEHTSELQS